MTLIAYCRQCIECFKNFPEYYWPLYETIVDRYIHCGQCHMLMCSENESTLEVESFVKELEKRNLLVTCDSHKWMIAAKPKGLTLLRFDSHPGQEIVQMCLDIENHHEYELSENLEEEE